MAEDAEVSAGTASPVPGPMAFTIEFGDYEGDQGPDGLKKAAVNERKKLALQDRLAKIKAKLKASKEAAAANSANSTASTASTSAEDTTTSSSDLVIKRKEVVVVDDKLTSNATPTSPRTNTVSPANPTEVILDEENNIAATSSPTNAAVLANHSKILPVIVPPTISTTDELATKNRDHRQTVPGKQQQHPHKMGRRGEGSDGSEAGTYTIDDDVADPKELHDEEDEEYAGVEDDEDEKAARDFKINKVFGVHDGQMSSKEWVSMWASTSFMENNGKILEEAENNGVGVAVDDHAEAEDGRVSSSSSQRRRLPATPSMLAKPTTSSGSATTNRLMSNSNGPTSLMNQFHNDDDDDDQDEVFDEHNQSPSFDNTNEYLRDTMSLVTAMEARIGEVGRDRRKTQVHRYHHQDANRSSSPRENVQPLSRRTAAGVQSSLAAAPLLSWISPRGAEAAASGSYSDSNAGPSNRRRPKTAGDVGSQRRGTSAAAKAKEAKEQAAAQWQRRKNYDPLRSMQAKTKVTTTKSLMGNGGGQNNNNSYTDESSDVESATSSLRMLPNQRVAMIRNDGGRHSLRGKEMVVPNGVASKTTVASAAKKAVLRSVGRGGTASGGAGLRSSSSLSSREAEFQAWKRRKNYNPMASAGGSPVRRVPGAASATGGSKINSSTNNSSSRSITAQQPNTRGHSAKTSNDNSSQPQHKRSASFHYPDGSSRITHSVYSSEDDFDDNLDDLDDQEPRLYEVNDDELFLAYDSGGVVHPNRRSPARRGAGPVKSSSSTASTASNGHKMEALDNLVISTIFSMSTKLCMMSGKLVRNLQQNAENKEEAAMLETLLYVLEDIDPPVSPSKKTSRELAGTLRNLKKVEQALQTTLERSGDM